MADESSPGAVDTSAAGIVELVDAFERQSIPQKAWTHEAHVLVALWYVLHDRDPLKRMRSGIQRLNSVHGVQTTRERGYHETLTRFYVWALQEYVGQRASEGAPATALSRLASTVLSYAHRELPLSYYSRELLFSTAARFGWVMPDLRPLGG